MVTARMFEVAESLNLLRRTSVFKDFTRQWRKLHGCRRAETATDNVTALCTLISEQFPCVKGKILKPAFLAIGAAVILGLLITVASLASRCAPVLEANELNKPHTPFEPCPADWMYYRKTCYYFTKDKLDWDESRTFCSSHNATLIVFNSREELGFLMEHLYHGLPWIGVHRTEEGGDLKWVTGTLYNQSLYEINMPGECAYLQPDSIFLSGCHFLRTWLCKKQLDF